MARSLLCILHVIFSINLEVRVGGQSLPVYPFHMTYELHFSKNIQEQEAIKIKVVFVG